MPSTNILRNGTVVVPLAGDSMRFQHVARVPKYLLSIKGRLMIEWALDNINVEPEQLVFVLRNDHQEEFDVKNIFQKLFGKSIQTVLVNRTDGAAQTVLCSKALINNSNPLVIRDGDCIIDAPIGMTEGISGQITYYSPARESIEAQSNKSYVSFDSKGNVLKIREKQIISKHAICGMYVFRNGDSFIRLAEEAIRDKRKSKGEYYIAPLFQRMMDIGENVIAVPARKVIDLGSPENVSRFETYGE